jgi:hypothetical protein
VDIKKSVLAKTDTEILEVLKHYNETKKNSDDLKEIERLTGTKSSKIAPKFKQFETENQQLLSEQKCISELLSLDPSADITNH